MNLGESTKPVDTKQQVEWMKKNPLKTGVIGINGFFFIHSTC